MKKLTAIIFTIIFLSCHSVMADEDLWDNYGDQNSYGQKAVSDKEFDKALESKQKKRKKRDKNIPKGDEFHQSNETEFIKKSEEELPVLCVPANLIIAENKVLPVGHYQIKGELKDGKPVLKMYQAHFVIAEIPAIETDDDFEQETVHFVKILDNGEKQIKIIFGSLDFNAYSIINIAE